jgi:DnaJ-class molecular chaperone
VSTAYEIVYPDDYYDGEDIDRDATCPDCGGSGCDSWESFMPCQHCDGEGYEWWR